MVLHWGANEMPSNTDYNDFETQVDKVMNRNTFQRIFSFVNGDLNNLKPLADKVEQNAIFFYTGSSETIYPGFHIRSASEQTVLLMGYQEVNDKENEKEISYIFNEPYNTDPELKKYIHKALNNDIQLDPLIEKKIIDSVLSFEFIKKKKITLNLSTDMCLIKNYGSLHDSNNEVNIRLKEFLTSTRPHTYEQWEPVRIAMSKMSYLSGGLDSKTSNMLDIVRTIHPEIKGFDSRYRWDSIRKFFSGISNFFGKPSGSAGEGTAVGPAPVTASDNKGSEPGTTDILSNLLGNFSGPSDAKVSLKTGSTTLEEIVDMKFEDKKLQQIVNKISNDLTDQNPKYDKFVKEMSAYSFSLKKTLFEYLKEQQKTNTNADKISDYLSETKAGNKHGYKTLATLIEDKIASNISDKTQHETTDSSKRGFGFRGKSS